MSRSMNQVVASKAVPWLETPDQAVVWGVALGLRQEVEGVLARSLGPEGGRRESGAHVHAPLVRHAGRGLVRRGGVGGGDRARRFSPGRRSRTSGNDVGHRHDREQPVVLGQRWLRRRRVRRRRRRLGRRLLAARADPGARLRWLLIGLLMHVRCARGAAASPPWLRPSEPRRSGGAWVRRRRRYTRAMGAVDTMEVFFEKLNAGDREGAVALMDERTEMRVHVGDSVQTLRGVDRVGGWFLRSERGLRMIPGEVRDMGNTYQADILVVRPGRAEPAPRCELPRGGRQDHRDQLRPTLADGPSRRAGGPRIYVGRRVRRRRSRLAWASG